jgi:hypothetical protein
MRKAPALILGATALLALVAVVVLVGNRSAAQGLDLVGISAQDLKAGGVVLERPMSGDRASVDAEHASDIAKTRHAAGAAVRQVVLSRMGDDLDLREKQLVWVVSFDPDTIEPMPPLGPGTASSSVDLETLEVVFALVFVDADTGEIVHSLQRTRGSPLVD